MKLLCLATLLLIVAGFLLGYSLAWTALFGNLALEAGQTILIRGATSALGQAAVNIAAHAGAQVQSWFKMNAYHAGVWSMMQEMEARALARQRARSDLSANLQRELQLTHFHVWRAIARNSDSSGV